MQPIYGKLTQNGITLFAVLFNADLEKGQRLRPSKEHTGCTETQFVKSGSVSPRDPDTRAKSRGYSRTRSRSGVGRLDSCLMIMTIRCCFHVLLRARW